ncbi:MAG: phytanoyl-CoA dioxygenase family protein [Verrucomicrobiae bacterium]|nr:phytanoyl-CoA dioxygenase family protein [Verrucomicrobiae bacterium]
MPTDISPLTPAQIETFNREGYVVLRGLIQPDEVREIRAEYDRRVEETETLNNGALRGKLIQCAGIATRDERWITKPYMERIVSVGRTLIEPEIGFWYDQIIMKPAGNPASTPWHQDSGYWKGLEAAVTCWLALSEVTDKHGCMEFIPGSHLEGLAVHEDASKRSEIRDALEAVVDSQRAVKVTMSPGDVSFHHSRTLHYTSGNAAATPRCGLVTHLGVMEKYKALGL